MFIADSTGFAFLTLYLLGSGDLLHPTGPSICQPTSLVRMNMNISDDRLTSLSDLTPFVPLLTDGKPHTFTIDVASAETDKAILSNWFVSGVLQVITDSSSKPTTGKITSYSAEPFAVSSTTGSVSDNGDISITVKASRQIHITADIVSGSGKHTHVAVSQNLEYVNQQDYLDNTLVQVC
jgi:hypothetical protein